MQIPASDHKSVAHNAHNEGVLARLRQKSTRLPGLLAHEWGLLTGFVIALFLFLVLFSYDPSDAGFFRQEAQRLFIIGAMQQVLGCRLFYCFCLVFLPTWCLLGSLWSAGLFFVFA